MSDIADDSDGKIQAAVEDGIAECRRKPSLIPMGACYNCGDPVHQHHLFCSSECGTDFHHRTQREKDTGR